MPPGGVTVHGEMSAALRRLAHEKFTSAGVGDALEAARQGIANEDPDSNAARMVAVVARDYARATRVPAEFVAEHAAVVSAAQHIWADARTQSNFSLFAPHLEKVVELKRRYVTFFPPADHAYDVLLRRIGAASRVIAERLQRGDLRDHLGTIFVAATAFVVWGLVAAGHGPRLPDGLGALRFGPAALAFVLTCPFAPLGAAEWAAVASFTKTYREAQTYLTFVLLVPTLPLAFATILNIEPEAKLMWIPSLSQHLLITTLIKDQPLEPSFAAISAVSSLAFGALLGWLAIRLYRREAILG
jgi:hypothetical protein